MRVLAPVQLTADDLHVLLDAARGDDKRARVRALIVLMAADGHSNRTIATTLGINDDQVARWRRRYETGGIAALADRPRSGRPRKRREPTS